MEAETFLCQRTSHCGKDWRPVSSQRLTIVAGVAGLLTVVGNVAPAADCNSANGCIGYEGMRVFASDPTVRGVI
jgi:hypothetical protein